MLNVCAQINLISACLKLAYNDHENKKIET